MFAVVFGRLMFVLPARVSEVVMAAFVVNGMSVMLSMPRKAGFSCAWVISSPIRVIGLALALPPRETNRQCERSLDGILADIGVGTTIIGIVG